MQQKNIMVQVGQASPTGLNTARACNLGGCWYYKQQVWLLVVMHLQEQEQQKNMMVHLGHLSWNSLNTARQLLRWFWITNSSSSSFWSSVIHHATDIAATEEYDGYKLDFKSRKFQYCKKWCSSSTGSPSAGVFFGGRAPPGEANSMQQKNTQVLELLTKTITVS
jgi:hypothetical protein